ncbi:hypothetical protein FEM33_09825 [Dyadobacter flavalbus]|uniref:Uncharacterized protein n=1 Tax=Dyadobacter flavalbus TaxID=2579942 RepID=A0A5M8QY71_9BACT|nr:hypothetical protein [Dyadobacter flavalbus]KAA6439990.1 hypothetical protein FEM33_09825 [Dyadobacter flavalbus]
MKMKLQTKLSASIVAASFSALLFMSSCSKDDALTPQPESAGLKDDANMRAGGPELSNNSLSLNVTEHVFPTTIDQPGKGKFPIWWQGNDYGTSSTQSLGNDLRWLTPLVQPQPNVETFITLKNYQFNMGWAKSDLTKLASNHKYRLTFYASTSSVQDVLSGSLSAASPYAKAIIAEVTSKSLDLGAPIKHSSKTISFVDKKDQWITATIEFTTASNLKSTEIKFYGKSPDGEVKPTYANVSVGKYAIEDLGKVN